MSRLRLALLGSPEIGIADRRVTLPTRKALALLAYLATEGGAQSREKLTALLWPESDAEHGRATLRRTLALLREAIERPDQPTPLAATRTTLAIEPGTIDLDLALLQRAAEARDDAPALWREAVTAYRGEFLDGFSLSDAPEFDDWASAQREHWHRQFGIILDRLARWQADHGETARMIETATRWIAHDPLNEAAHRRLMEARFAAGERTAALESYAACRAILARELGTEPSPETSTLAARIRAAAPPQPRTQTTRPTSGQLPEPPLLGRAEEFAALIARREALRAGQAGLAVVVGEAGIGKTRLADEFLSRALALGATILRGRAFETDRQLPYQPLIDAIRPQLSRSDDPRALLPAIWLAELSRLLPELRERLPDLAAPTADESVARTRLFAAVARLGQALAQVGPLVLAVDDLQWADDASLDLLGYLGRRWADEGTPILLLLTVRSEALHHQADLRTPSLSEWLGGLERAMPATHLVLGSLTPEATGGIAAAILAGAPDAREFGTWLHRETGGQPFYIAETLKALVERGVIIAEAEGWALRSAAWRQAESGGALLPPGVRDVIRARVARVGREAQLLLAAGAVLGHGFSFAQLCQVADLNEDAALDALDAALSGHLLREEGHGGTYGFAHDKIRDVVYTEAGDARRRIYHRRALAALEHEGAAAAELARHALAAHLPEPSARHNLTAGEDALRLFAVRDAIAHFERAREALDSLPPGGTTLELHQQLAMQAGRAYELSGQWEAAQEAYERVLATAQQAGGNALEIAALNHLATLVVHRRLDLATATELLSRALRLGEEHGEHAALAETHWNFAQMAFYSRDPWQTLEHGERALTLARELGLDEVIARSANVLSYGHLTLAHWDEAIAMATEATRRYTILGNQAMAVDSLCLLANGRTCAGDPALAATAAREAQTIAREIENPWGQVNAAYNLAPALLELGEKTEALTIAQAGATLARDLGVPVLNCFSLVALGAAQRANGMLAEALATHQEALAVNKAITSHPFVEMMAAELCTDAALAGDWTAAHGYARQALDARDGTFYFYSGLLRPWEIEALVRGGDAAPARDDVEQFAAQVANGRRYRIAMLRARAVLEQHDGDRTRAVDTLSEARALVTAIGLPAELRAIDRALGTA